MDGQGKNNIFIVIICVLVVIIVGLIGWLVWNGNLQKSKEIPNNPTSPTEDKVEEKEYDLAEAKKLVDIYVGLIKYRNYNSDEYYMALIAFNNLNEEKKTSVNNAIELTPYFNTQTEAADFTSSSNSWIKVKYQDLNEIYKYLFGSNTKLEKKDYYYSKQKVNLKYTNSNSNDTFIAYRMNATGMSDIYASKVIGAKIVKDVLQVDVLYSIPDEGTITTFNSPYSKKEYSYDDVQKYIDEESNNFDKYEFTFEYEDNHYILKDIVKK